MRLGCGATCAKYLLIIFNLIFWLSGAAILGIGIWIRVDKNILAWQDLVQVDTNDKYIDIAAYVLIGVGAFVFIVGFFGCCGALRESRCMLGVYITFMVLVMVGELGAGALGAWYRGENYPGPSKYRRTAKFQITSKLKESLQKSLKKADTSDAGSANVIMAVWDKAQIFIECCGVDSYRDWNDTLWMERQRKTTDQQPIKLVPPSCCYATTKHATDPSLRDVEKCLAEAAGPTAQPTTELHRKGCYPTTYNNLKEHLVIIIAVACGIAALEIFGFIFAVCLCRSIGDLDKD